MDPDGVERVVDNAAIDGGALPLVLTLTEVVGEWLTVWDPDESEQLVLPASAGDILSSDRMLKLMSWQ